MQSTRAAVLVDTPCHAWLDSYEPVETLLHEVDRTSIERAVLGRQRCRSSDSRLS